VALRVVSVGIDTLADWQTIHNLIIPTSPLSVGDVAERSGRYRLTLGYHDACLVGNATVRPPAHDVPIATVIVRILPEFRRRGFGSQYLEWVLSDARSLGARCIETHVLASNADALSFAQHRGFVEFNRYLLDGHSIPFIELCVAEEG
jgi:GNAT superfamily N-acetyltransferase